MNRTGLISNCRHRAVWDRPAPDTRLLPWPKPVPVSLGRPIDPLRMTLIASAPSWPTCPSRPRAADARVPSPRMITHGSHPQRACPTTVDACGIAPRMTSRSVPFGVEADACGIAPRMTSRSAPSGVEADACGIAPRMNSRSAPSGVEADACGTTPRMTSRVPTLRAAARAAEGALATLILTPSPSISPFASPSRNGDRLIALDCSIPLALSGVEGTQERNGGGVSPLPPTPHIMLKESA